MANRRYFSLALGNEHSGYQKFTFDSKITKTAKDANIRYKSIYDAYGKASSIKKDIWHTWAIWFHRNNGKCWIESRNGWQFTIGGYVIDESGKVYYCHITKARNECYLVE